MSEKEAKTKESILEENKILKLKVNKLLDELEKEKTIKMEINSNVQQQANDKFEIDITEQEESEAEQELRKSYLKEEDTESIMIGISGSGRGIGTTHTAISLAIELISKGGDVAVIEQNETKAFSGIREIYKVEELSENAFTYQGIDFYEGLTLQTLEISLQEEYEFLIIDYGNYYECDLDSFLRCDKKIVVAGAKPWEQTAVMNIFDSVKKEMLRQYNFFFNHVPLKQRNNVISGMGKLKKVFFIEYNPEPFESGTLDAAQDFMKEYFPEEETEEKRGFFGRFIKK